MSETPSQHDGAHHRAGRPLNAVILAAGKGTRMPGDMPKVLYEVAGRPMVWWVVEAVRRCGAARIVLVVGHGADLVRAAFADDDEDLIFAVQEEQLGTGHAIRCAEPALGELDGDVLVLAGDGPLIRPETIRAMREAHVESGAAATLGTSEIEDPTGYGRIIRSETGAFEAIVEQKSATPEQLRIREIYPSYAIFDGTSLFATLATLKPDSRSGEYYVTAVPNLLRSRGAGVALVDGIDPEDVLSINTLEQLDAVDAILTRRLTRTEREQAR